MTIWTLKFETVRRNMAEHEATTAVTSEKECNALFEFLQNIQHKTLFQQNEKHIKDLESGVKEIVQKIIDAFYSDGKYDFDEMIHVGSSYEGSKIISPDEFDFMLVLKTLSQPGKLLIAQGCQPGMKLIRHTKFERSESSGPNLLCNNVLGLEIDSVMTCSDVRRAKQKTIKVQTSLGELRIKDMLRYTLYLECINSVRNFDIKVDLMPSIRIHCDTKEVKKDMILCPTEIKELAFKDGCFLVGKFCVIDGMCWQLSFAAAERNMMKSLSPGHMKIYRILKYLFVEKSIVGICDLMSSYVLKTIVLRHAFFQCAGETKPTKCFVAVIRSLASALGSGFMSSLFVPSLNLWQRVIQEKMRNITENDTICDKFVKDKLIHIISQEGRQYSDALKVTVIFEFWKRVFWLLADVFESTEQNLLTKHLMENVLRVIFTKLNEEDEDDDLYKDYFEQENVDNKTTYGNNDWEIFRSSANVEKDTKTQSCTSAPKENVHNSVKKNEPIAILTDDADIVDTDSEDESHDLSDIESYVNAYVKETGEHFDSDEESNDNSEYTCSDDEDSDDDNNFFVQAEQEDVYQLFDKYQADINAVEIPVFTDLLDQISKIEPCQFIQNILEKNKVGENAPDLNDRFEEMKRRKISN